MMSPCIRAKLRPAYHCVLRENRLVCRHRGLAPVSADIDMRRVATSVYVQVADMVHGTHRDPHLAYAAALNVAASQRLLSEERTGAGQA